MTDPPDRVRAFLSVRPGDHAGSGPRPVEETPFEILVLGDFSGRGPGARDADPPFGQRSPMLVDDPDEALHRIRPEIGVSVTGRAVSLRFGSLEDFHPDRVVDRVPELSVLLDEIDQAVSRYRGPPATSGEEGESDAEGGTPSQGGPGLLDAVVERTSRDVLAPESMSDLKEWIRDVVEPHLVEVESGERAALRSRLEAGAAELVAEVLGTPGFRALESLWQSLLFLLAAVAGNDVRVRILDVSRDELQADLSATDPLSSGLARHLTPDAGARPPALVVGAFEFGGGVEDVALLNRIAMVADDRGVPWVSAGLPELTGCTDYADRYPWPLPASQVWPLFRATPAARRVGLAAPRFLLRSPYGPGGEPCERLPVDEVSGGTGRDAYVWGNPAFVVAAGLAAQFQDRGWGFTPSAPVDFNGTPAHALPDGRVGANPTEAIWTADAADRVRASGLIPLVGFRGEARMRLQSFASVSDPPAPLAAWWRKA